MQQFVELHSYNHRLSNVRPAYSLNSIIIQRFAANNRSNCK